MSDVLQERRRTVAKAGAGNALFLVLLVGVVVFANLVGSRVSWRFDLTRDQRYTLSEASRSIVRAAEHGLQAYVFISSEMPAPYDAVSREITDLLEEYRANSNGNFDFVIVDPGNDDADKERAANFGIEPVTIGENSRDALSFREVYMGLALVYAAPEGDRQDVIPQLYPGMNHEYELTRRMRTLVNAGGPPRLGIAIGDGSFIDILIAQATTSGDPSQPPPQRDVVIDQLETDIGEGLFDNLFDVELVDITQAIPDDLNGLILLGPTPEAPLGENAARSLDAYVQSGRGLAVFASRYRTDQAGAEYGGTGFAEENTTGLEPLFAAWGIRLGADRLIDREAAQVSVTYQTLGRMGDQPIRQPLPTLDPRLPLITTLNQESLLVPNVPLIAFQPADRTTPLPITGIEILDSARTAAESGGLTLTEVASTSETSVRQQNALTLSLEESVEPVAGESAGAVPVIVTLEGRLPSAFADSSTESARVLVASSGDFITNALSSDRDPLRNPRVLRSMPPEVVGSVQQYSVSAILFIKNAADWLVSDADLVRIRGRGIPAYIETSSLTRENKTFFQLVNVAGVPLAFVGVGIVAALSRRRRRAELARKHSSLG
jgi:ABC-type uncharacterized transport system involved in gliding motility auxiliary subunit